MSRIRAMTKCIYKPFQTAPDKWNVTCLPIYQV